MSTRLRLVGPDGVFLDRWGIELPRRPKDAGESDHRPWFGIFLHKLEGPDPGQDLHNHPWPFFSFILRGGYTEERAQQRFVRMFAEAAERGFFRTRGIERRRRWLSLGATPLDYSHRITKLHRTPTWTLVVHGRRHRTWGFWLPAGWIDWRTYEATVRAERRDAWAEISSGGEYRLGPDDEAA